jgi:hypothetical protein
MTKQLSRRLRPYAIGPSEPVEKLVKKKSSEDMIYKAARRKNPHGRRLKLAENHIKKILLY